MAKNSAVSVTRRSEAGPGRGRSTAGEVLRHATRPVVRAARGDGGPAVWSRPGRVHLGVPGLDGTAAQGWPAALVAAAQELEGVRWAAVNAPLGCLVVDAGAGADVGRLAAAVAEVCREYGVDATLPGGRAPHPGDAGPARTAALGLITHVAGAGAALGGRLLRLAPLPAEVTAVTAVTDVVPWLRDRLRQHLGDAAAELAGSVTAAGLAAAAQTPLSSVAEAVLRAVQWSEARARVAGWSRREPELVVDAHSAAVPPARMPVRPVPLPPGPAERYLGWVARLAAPAAAVAALGGVQRAARVVTVAAPKAARMGREAYAARLGRLLAERGVVVRDPAALRRLDRADTVVVDAAVLTTGRLVVVELHPVDERPDPQLAHRARLLLDEWRPGTVVEKDAWRLGPPSRVGTSVPAELRARGSRAPGHHRLALHTQGRLVATVVVAAEIAPLAEAVVEAARAVGRVVVAGRSAGIAERLGADDTVAGGTRLGASVRRLQQQGAVVVLVGGRNDVALTAADCGIGVVGAGPRPPWGAHLLCGPGLGEVWLALHGAAGARANGLRAARLAALGTATGAVVGFTGPQAGAGDRATVPISLTALAGIAAGGWSVAGLARRGVPVAADARPWHAWPLAEVWRRLDSSAAGLSEDEAAARRPAPTAVDDDEPQGLLAATVAELDTPLTAPLAAGAGVSAATGSVGDAGLVGGVLLGNALLGGVQRLAASRALRRLVDTTALRVRLRRGGAERTGNADDLVPGDVITLRSGDAVPADCRLVEADALEMDESALTGESLPVPKSAAPSVAAAVAERTSMLYAGSTVAAGTATAVVVAVGRATEAGRSIAAVAGAPTGGGVEARLQRMTAASVPVAVAAAGALLGVGALRGRFAASVGDAVALAVAAVPEGLPFVATVAQLAAARRLSRRNVLVRNPRTMEALGRVDVVCFDKTGTLTAGRISLGCVSDGATDEPAAALTGQRRAVLAAALRATPVAAGGELLPHPTDRAVADGGRAAGVAVADAAPGWRQVRELPFEPGRGFHAVLGDSAGGRLISVKGAPETVLPRCVTRRGAHGAPAPLDAPGRELLAEQVERLARRGYRVLAIAERAASARRHLDDDRVDDLEFCGLLGLADPVRPTAAAAVRQLRSAGVEVAMLTGDHPSTARAIAAELGILDGHPPVTGAQLDACTDDELARLVDHASVFARVSPAHKVTIARMLRRNGRIVAMTGDGANDAPAIRLADVGVAVGAGATAAAREAADLIVTDDRIETIVDAVVEGRAMWASVRDSVALLLGGNLGEIGFTLGSSLLAATPPLNARQLLLVNLVTDLLPALALAVRPPRDTTPEQLLREGPDSSLGESLIRDTVVRAAATGLAATGGWLAARATGTPGRAGTVALASLIGAQLAQTAVASRGDPLVLAAAAGSAAALVLLLQAPPTSLFFGCRPLGPVAWSIAAVASAAGVALAAAGGRLVTGASQAGRTDEAAGGGRPTGIADRR
ncbi:HAD-IC family P-type ATPase [Couchioplanes caeruleus subsp. azureus]|uniref:cation-translocating P-type ATPase n=1 Tax=Couchioplanes caeruleus TaxID=56438 RepID=UPI00360E3A70